MAATLLNSSAGKALLDSMPNSTRVPYNNTNASTGTNRWRTPAMVSVCQCALDAAFIQKGEEAIQQAGFIQPVDRIDALPTVQGLRDGLIIPFRKLPVQQFAQIRVYFFSGLAGLAHRCLLLALG